MSDFRSPESIYTLRRAREILENIDQYGQLFNYSVIIQIAQRAQLIGQEALDQVLHAMAKYL